VALPASLPVAGAILSDHLKSADWQARGIEHAGAAPPEVLAEVRAKLKPLLGT
jgi:mRNA interferase MazF